MYEWVDNKYYVGTITNITTNEITVNLMKKYTMNDNKVTFVWQTEDHFVVIDDLAKSKCLTFLQQPILDRQGSSVIFNLKVFKNVPQSNIC